MPVLYATTPGTRISLTSERLEIVQPPLDGSEPERVHSVHLRDVEQIVIASGCHITTPALSACVARGIPVVLLAGPTHVVGLCVPSPPLSPVRRQQYKVSLDVGAALAIARKLVRAKILNQRRVLQRLSANRPGAFVAEPIEKLRSLADSTEKATHMDILRGIEGAAAGLYYTVYGSFFPDHCPFEYRSRRPPHNAANALLSYAYTRLAVEVEVSLWLEGFDPAIGFYHEPDTGRPALALDLMEPYRAPLADALALDMISHKMLDPEEHFEPHNGGVFLKLDGKRRFFLNYEKRMTREFLDRTTGVRTTLRGAIQRDVQNLRLHLMEGKTFEPFLMP